MGVGEDGWAFDDSGEVGCAAEVAVGDVSGVEKAAAVEADEAAEVGDATGEVTSAV